MTHGYDPPRVNTPDPHEAHMHDPRSDYTENLHHMS